MRQFIKAIESPRQRSLRIHKRALEWKSRQLSKRGEILNHVMAMQRFSAMELETWLIKSMSLSHEERLAWLEGKRKLWVALMLLDFNQNGFTEVHVKVKCDYAAHRIEKEFA